MRQGFWWIPYHKDAGRAGGCWGCPYGGGYATKPCGPFLPAGLAGLGGRMWHGLGTNWVVAASRQGLGTVTWCWGRKWLLCGPQQREETSSHFLLLGVGREPVLWEVWGRAGDVGQGWVGDTG